MNFRLRIAPGCGRQGLQISSILNLKFEMEVRDGMGNEKSFGTID
jgi:hypothetical protein